MSERMPQPAPADQPWLVALDVDGTILHEDESIDERVADAIGSARERGHEVTLATGRSWSTTAPVLQRLGLAPEYVVCANGAITMRRDDAASDGYVREHVETFDPTRVLERIRAFLPSGRFMVELPDGYRLYTEGMTDWNLENAREVSFEGLLDQRATRVVVVSPDHELEDFLRIVEEMGLHQVSYAIGWTAWLDIAADGVNKATAMERVRVELGIPRERVIAVADGRNDIELLTWASERGRGVAMGQSPADVIEAAGELTGTVHEDGLAQVLASL
jgi:5-amino-6-(5-phospho-D-ribitylamino)uracil phosphatase